MIGKEFRQRREKVELSQADVAVLLKLSRSTVMAMEASDNPVSPSIAVAMEHWFERRWRQRPLFGPVTLVYSDGPMFIGQGNYRVPMMQCEPFGTNAEAVARVCELYNRGAKFFNPLINSDGGHRIVLNSMEIAKAYERKLEGKPPLPSNWPPKVGDDL